MLLTVILYTALGMVGMCVQDFCATFLTICETRNRYEMAARLDAVSDLCKFVLFSYSGSKLMEIGPSGWCGIPFILATGYVTTKWATREANRRYPQTAIEPAPSRSV